MSDNNQQALPFFARYLEGQFCEDLSVEEMDEVQGGLTLHLRPKYPPTIDPGIIMTLKSSSDQEEGGGHPVVTKKYPSDADEAVTNKYPSDGDDHITISPIIYA